MSGGLLQSAISLHEKVREAHTSIVNGDSTASPIDALNGVNCETLGVCTSYSQDDRWTRRSPSRFVRRWNADWGASLSHRRVTLDVFDVSAARHQSFWQPINQPANQVRARVKDGVDLGGAEGSHTCCAQNSSGLSPFHPLQRDSEVSFPIIRCLVRREVRTTEFYWDFLTVSTAHVAPAALWGFVFVGFIHQHLLCGRWYYSWRMLPTNPATDPSSSMSTPNVTMSICYSSKDWNHTFPKIQDVIWW